MFARSTAPLFCAAAARSTATALAPRPLAAPAAATAAQRWLATAAAAKAPAAPKPAAAAPKDLKSAAVAASAASTNAPPPVTSPITSSCEPKRTTLLFSIEDGVGTLDEVLRILATDLGISLTRIESRPSKTKEWDYDFFVDFDAADQAQIDRVVAHLSTTGPARVVRVASNTGATDAMPWFPRKLTDLDSFSSKVLSFGAELDADHPGFTDAAYRERRARITANAAAYRTGMPLPHVEYTTDEVKTWGLVYDQLTALYATHACREHQYIFRLLEKNCGYARDNIPQQADISKFLKECTGFTIRPVMGLLSSRDFLNALAFRVFYGTQYIRHHSKPYYTPEPDICHELLGHVPLFADPDFAEFSQQIGMASIGASDADIKKLATVYWFTVEYGMCKEGDALKAYGAGLLSSIGELEYCVSGKPELRPFDPARAAVTEYPICEFQPVYYVAESFRDAKDKVREYAAGLKRPFSVRYNAVTETIEVLDTKEKLVRLAQSLRSELYTLSDALEKLP
ncbi:hypothetical protein H9P43_008160 [Blastocladiella emersonii ATCC 22665]|nr:hypothetical protein H9P43_008160 [Blastocladiella emersonii ATCC 22665]